MITGGHRLPARHVIHAVGPVWDQGDEHEEDLLGEAYRSSLRLAAQHGLRSISFPSISTGAFCYPIRRAAPVALKAIVEFLEQERHGLELVRLVLYPRENAAAYRVYAAALERILREPEQTQPITE